MKLPAALLISALITHVLFAQASLPPVPKATLLDISNSRGHTSEPGIALNPNNPSQIVAVYQGGAEVQGQGAAAYSTDSGKTFTIAPRTAIPDWHVIGDVTITFDNRGRAFWCDLVFDHLGTTSYWAHHASRNGILVRSSPDAGQTWSKPVAVRTFPTGHEPDLQFEDEPRIFADTGAHSSFAGNLYVGWVEWQIDKSVMLFSRSTDAGQSWSAPLRIDAHAGLPRDDNGSLGGYMQAIASDGTIYAMWHDGNSIVLTASHDGGQTFSHPEPIIETAPVYFGEVPGVSRVEGFGQIAIDNHTGRLYVTWSDYRNGDVDVFLSSSADHGQTWSPALRVNDDPVHDGIDQFYQSLAVDPVTDAVYVVFYDRRTDPKNHKLGITLARSTDGASSFRNYAWTSAPFEGQNAFLGDYTWITAYNNHVYAAWTETVPSPKVGTPHAAPPPRSPLTKIRVGTADFSDDTR